MATTTNYGWTTPDDTALVKDGAAAIRSLGTSIDSTLKTQIDAQIPDSLLTTTGDVIYASAANTPARLGIGTSGQVLQVSGGLPAWGVAPSGGMTLISTTTLTGATVSLTSIPSSYNDLRVVIKNFLPSTDAKFMQMRFNGDATASRHSDQSGGTQATNATFSRSDVGLGQRNDNAVGNGLIVFDIYDYKNTTTWKMASGRSFTVDATTTTNFGYQILNLFYNQTAAISSLDFIVESGGNFTSGTVLLYGVK